MRIQSCVRGYIVRHRLREALHEAQNYCQEIDLGYDSDAEEELLNIVQLPDVRDGSHSAAKQDPHIARQIHAAQQRAVCATSASFSSEGGARQGS